MPMNFGNVAIQNAAEPIWDGAAGIPVDLRHHIQFGISFKVTADLAADTIFNAMTAPADTVDPCLPGTFVPVEEILLCEAGTGAVPGPQATIMLPAGTKAGSRCAATLPCKPGAFLTLAAASGDTANVVATAVLHGPI